jgi:hypothetical protein
MMFDTTLAKTLRKQIEQRTKAALKNKTYLATFKFFMLWCVGDNHAGRKVCIRLEAMVYVPPLSFLQ